jgi:hypothetical protein
VPPRLPVTSPGAPTPSGEDGRGDRGGRGEQTAAPVDGGRDSRSSDGGNDGATSGDGGSGPLTTTIDRTDGGDGLSGDGGE